MAITRADVKDLAFPGNLQEIMNKVLAAEGNSQAQLVEARTNAAVQRIEAETKSESQRLQAAADAEAVQLMAAAQRQSMEELSQSAAADESPPSLLRLEELAILRELAKNANARLYLDFKEPPSESQ